MDPLAPLVVEDSKASLLLSDPEGLVRAIVDRPALVAIACILVLLHLGVSYMRSPWRRVPPGPAGYPVIGSALKLFDKDWLIHQCKEYGDVVYLNVAGQPTVVFNSQLAAADLLDRRASTCSSRPRIVVGNELLSGGQFFSLEPRNDRWRRMRRGVHEAFRGSAAARYYGMQEEEAARLALNLSNGPAVRRDFAHYYHSFAGSLVLAITYDRPIRGAPDDKDVLANVEAFDRAVDSATAPGAHMADIWPAMLRIPARWAKWKRDALQNYERTTAFFAELADGVKARMVTGQARPCLMKTLSEEGTRFGLSQTEAVWAAGIMYAVGSETVSTTLDWWTLAMVSFPETQRRAQAELDIVIGHARAPRVTDRPHLPYVNAMVREILRWRTGLPIGLPHKTEEDEWYRGMFIPKGTVCFVNMWPCNLDPEVYGEDAHKFDPARHLNEKGYLKPAPPDTREEGHVSFGFGRRICVGRYVANDALFAAIATLLWAFDLENVGDADILGYHDKGMTMHPKSFGCTFKPRFPEAIAILAGELESR